MRLKRRNIVLSGKLSSTSMVMQREVTLFQWDLST